MQATDHISPKGRSSNDQRLPRDWMGTDPGHARRRTTTEAAWQRCIGRGESGDKETRLLGQDSIPVPVIPDQYMYDRAHLKPPS